jgi:NAD(P)-dependent dehydrogenase (short-subunit alcohol dehydrogenase family)
LRHKPETKAAIRAARGHVLFFSSMSDVFREQLLRGKSAFLTGASSGIGLGIAERFAEHGAKVTIVGRSQEKLDVAVAAIQAQGGEAAAYALDVRQYDALAAAIQSARERYGEIDILVCGAAGNFPAAAIGMSANGFKAVIDIDVLGTFNACRAAYEHLRKPGACVINISATHAFRPIALQSHVCAAKAAVDSLTKTLALEWGPVGIRVNSVTPGPVEDTEGMRRLAPDEDARQRVAQSVPLRRFATKREIADLSLFLCSDAAQYITGAICICDGGQSLSGGGLAITRN